MLLVVGFLALTRAFVLGEDRHRRRWGAGVALFVLGVLAAASGWLLPGRAADPLGDYVVHVVLVPIAGVLVLLWACRAPRPEEPS